LRNKKSIKPKFEPKTIADLKIEWCFTKTLYQFEEFCEWFDYYNLFLNKYKIKEDVYIFEIELIDNDNNPFIFTFEFKSKNDNLPKLMWKIHLKIAEKLNDYDLNVNQLHLFEFKTTAFNNAFVIKYDLEIPF
jgi:hypothetical protein